MKHRARSFRKKMTDAERRLWYFLRDRRLEGHKFVRQIIIGPYIVDFVCREKKVVVEVDGGQHLDAVPYDQRRTEFLKDQGYQVVRFWNDEVLVHMAEVLGNILRVLGK